MPSSYVNNLYQTPRTTGEYNSYRPRYPYQPQDIRKSMGDYDRAELVSFSRQLFCQLGNLSAAILQKNGRAVGDSWRAKYTGQNESWGAEVEAWLANSFYPTCDVRGEPYDFTTNLYLSGIAWDVDGEDLMILTENPDNHFPMLQFLPANRIASNPTEVKGGPYDGAKVTNGMVYDKSGKIVAIMVIVDYQEEPQPVSIFNCQHLYDPRWQSQNRGIPSVSTAILDFFDIQDIDSFLKRGVKKAASVGLLHTNVEGQPDAGQEFIEDAPTGDVNSGVKLEKITGGEDYYFTAGKGEQLEALEFNNPSENVEAFIARLERRGLLAVSWFYELLDPSKIGGASVRLIQDEARASVRHRQKTLKKRAKRAVTYAVAKGMKYGFISKNNQDWWMWDFEMPAQLTVDSGNDAKADMDAMRMGLLTESEYHAKNGDTEKVINLIKQKELSQRIARAEEVSKKTGKPFDWVYQQLWNPSPNPQVLLADDAQETPAQQGIKTK